MESRDQTLYFAVGLFNVVRFMHVVQRLFSGVSRVDPITQILLKTQPELVRVKFEPATKNVASVIDTEALKALCPALDSIKKY